MPLAPREYAAELLAEAREAHPWLHHRLFRMICDGELGRDQVRHVVREQGAFFLDTLRHAAWKIISVGGFIPTFEDLERQRALIPLVVEEGGHDTIGGKQTAHAYLFVRLCEGLGQLQREGTLEALCGGNIATESINHVVSARMAAAMEKHYGVPRASLDFYYEHMEVEEDHGERAIRILSRIALTDETQARGRLALRRAIAVRRLCADGMYDAFISGGRS